MRKVSSKKRASKMRVAARVPEHGHGYRVLARPAPNEVSALEAYRRGLADGMALGCMIIDQAQQQVRRGAKKARRAIKRPSS